MRGRQIDFRIAILIILSMILILSCGSWKKEEQIISPIWSDDNSEIAYVLNRYDFKGHWPAGGESKNHYFDIYRMDADLSSKQLIASDIRGQAGELFFMKTQGYFIGGTRDKEFLW
ncbi:MAG: hypothetical protein WD361_06200 [Gracilimonas sp.]